MVINFRGLMKFGIWAPTLYKVDISNVLPIMPKNFFRSLNAIFGNIGRNASEEVMLELIRSKCIPILIYRLECFAHTKSDLKSLDFAVNRFLMKLFRSNNTEIIAECRRYFQFNLPGKLIEHKKTKFEEYVLVLRDICVRLSYILIKFIFLVFLLYNFVFILSLLLSLLCGE